jgi:aryl-alcohol dehydrogenase-like predicted oxidoreductase
MSFSGAYGEANDEDSLKVLSKAIEIGCTFWDTAQVYGQGHNETLIGRFLKENPGTREKVFIGSKCGFTVSRIFQHGDHADDCRKTSRLPTSQNTFMNLSKRLLSDSVPLQTFTTFTESTPIHLSRRVSRLCKVSRRVGRPSTSV